MTRRKHRRLRPDEEELWSRIARTATPMHRSPLKHETTEPIRAVAEKPCFELRPFQIGAKSETALPKNEFETPLKQRLDAPSLRMDQKAFARMKRGKAAPEARIDLHGMTVGAAHSALIGFILGAHSEGKRLVLVITGKGRIVEHDDPMPVRTGVLRHQVPHWLAQPPLSQAILQVTEAHRRHGGSGAFYVYLARRR